jgi:hypothetical protein
MIIDQINIAGAIRLFAIAEDQAPVAGDGETPESLQVASERVKLLSRKPTDLLKIVSVFEGEQKLAQLAGHSGGHLLWIAFVELPKPFVAKMGKGVRLW